MRVTAVIPARFASTRLPGKPLLRIGEKPMIQWVYERVSHASLVRDVLVATDDQRILDAVKNFGGKGVMTSSAHRTGTDRIAEAVKDMDSEIIVNVQGDEPFIDPEVIDACIRPVMEEGDTPVATPCTRIQSREELLNPDVVKTVADRNGFALYFSRSPIPFDRDNTPDTADSDRQTYMKHIGLYVYNRNFLILFSRMEPTPLEKREKLEQLRVLENGYKIRLIETLYDAVGVDSEEDLERARELVKTGAVI